MYIYIFFFIFHFFRTYFHISAARLASAHQTAYCILYCLMLVVSNIGRRYIDNVRYPVGFEIWIFLKIM